MIIPGLLWMVLIIQYVLCENPCVPNPCGEHTRCFTQPAATSSRPVISCQCLPGFTPNPSGPFDGCLPPLALDIDEEELPGLEPTTKITVEAVNTTSESTTTSTPTTITSTPTASSSVSTEATSTTDRPYAYPTRRTVVGFDSSGTQVTFHATQGRSPGGNEIGGGTDDLNPISLSSATAATSGSADQTAEISKLVTRAPSHLDNLDLDAIYHEECLINEDCSNVDYCNTSIKKCENACNNSACGTGASCKGRLHRPVCFCPKGSEGNPHVECTKVKSRAGTKFRK